MLFFFGISVVLACTTAAAEECHDMDPLACHLMYKQRQDLCSDEAVAKTACPKFCNMCPVVCYHCNATVTDYHLCNTTLSCPAGHMCMRKELKSVIDGHHAFEMTCADKQECDDPWNSLSAFGKRHLESRDVSVSCCATDLCNYPEQTKLPPPTTKTTTALLSRTTTPTKTDCIRDLVLVVDESNSLKRHESDVQNFLLDLVSRLPVSDTEVHVSLGLFAERSRTIFDLNDLPSKSQILRALSTQTLHGGTGDINAGLNYILDHALTPAAGDRLSASNVVIIINDDGTSNKNQIVSLENKIHSKAEVISVEIGLPHFVHLPSDALHLFHMTTSSDLHRIVQQVADLIC